MMMMMTVMMLMTRGELFMRTYIILLFIPIIFLKGILTRYKDIQGHESKLYPLGTSMVLLVFKFKL